MFERLEVYFQDKDVFFFIIPFYLALFVYPHIFYRFQFFVFIYEYIYTWF